MRLKLLFILLIVFSSPSNAKRTKLAFKSFGVNDGLSQGNVTCILQDHYGLMWFGTWDGLNVYDGFKNITFNNRGYNSDGIRGVLINNIMEIDSNRVAIGTYSSLSIFDRERQEFKYYSDKKGNKSNIRIIKKLNDTLIITDNNSISYFDLLNKKFIPAHSYLTAKWNAVMLDRKNGVNRSEYLFSRIYELITLYPELIADFQKIFSKYTVNDIFIDHSRKRIFIGCEEGFYVYNCSKKNLSPVILNSVVKCLSYFDDQLYIGTQSEGLYVFDTIDMTTVGHYSYDELSKRSVTGNFIRTMYIDDQKNLWLSVLGSGVNYCSLISRIAHTIFTYSDLPLNSKQNNYIKAVAEDKDSLLWVATVTGMIWLLNNEEKIIDTILPEQIDPINKPGSIQFIYVNNSNQKFLITDKGLYVSDLNRKFKRAQTDLLDEYENYLQAFVKIDDSNYLVGSRKGLFLYDAGSNYLEKIIEQNTKYNTIHYLYKDNNGLVYVNTLFDGIDVLKIKNRQLIHIKRIDLDLNLKSCYETNDSLYFASTKGILIINKKSFKYRIIGEQDGLPNQNLYSILPENNSDSVFWFSSNHGIFSYNIYNGKHFTLGLNDGLNSLEFNTAAYVSRLNGDYVFGGIDGLTIFTPVDFPKSINLNKLNIVNLSFDNLSAINLLETKEGGMYNIPFENNGFSCRLIQVNFPNFETQLRYKLIGRDKNWNNGLNPIEIRYSSLSEGDYELLVQYYDRDNGWITKSALKFKLLPPWYRTWWANASYFLIITGLIAMANRVYINNKLQKKREELVRKEVLLEERGRISSDLHDDLGSTLSSISIYSEAIKNRLFQNEEQHVAELVSQIGETARESISNLSDIVWAINPSNDRAEFLIQRMESFANSILTVKNIEVVFNFDSSLLKKEFNMELRQNLFLIYKEVINNISKYSEATFAKIDFRQEKDGLLLRIEDNGIGFKLSDEIKSEQNGRIGGNGIRNMNLRTAQLKGQISIESNASGSIIELTIPLVAGKQNVSPI